MLFLIILFKKKTAAFYTYVYRALTICSDPLNLSNEFNYLKSLAMSKGYNPSVTDKALNKLKMFKRCVYHSDPCLNPVILPFYSSISLKISKILSRFDFKNSSKPVTKIEFSSPKDLILTGKQSDI